MLSSRSSSNAGCGVCAERCVSGDGERKTLLTRQIAFEPVPASVLFALGCGSRFVMRLVELVRVLVFVEPSDQLTAGGRSQRVAGGCV